MIKYANFAGAAGNSYIFHVGDGGAKISFVLAPGSGVSYSHTVLPQL
jgi:hypothetical protein